MNRKRIQHLYNMIALRGCRHLRAINRSTESPMFAVFDSASFEVSPDRRRRHPERGDERRRTKLVRRTRNGSSPYFCDSSRPVHPSGGGSHYRSMDGRGGKGEKGSSSIRAPSSRGPLSLFLPPGVPFAPFSPSSFDPISLSPSLAEAIALSLSPASVTCSSLGFRYLIKSSYDEKDEDSTRSERIRRGSFIRFYGPPKRPCSRERNWGMIMRGR